LTLEDRGVGFVADGDEDAVQVDVFGGSSLTFLMRMPVTPVLSPSTSSSTWFQARPDVAVLGLVEQLLLQDLLGAQRIAAVHQRDLGGDVGQIQRLLDRGVAAADDGDLLIAVEKAVAGGAGGNAAALEGSSDSMPRYIALAPVAMISASQV
jgi:hypothetical protein